MIAVVWDLVAAVIDSDLMAAVDSKLMQAVDANMTAATGSNRENSAQVVVIDSDGMAAMDSDVAAARDSCREAAAVSATISSDVECDDQNGGNGLNRAGDGTKDGGRLVGHWHRNRLSTCAGGNDGDDRKSDEGCTKSGKEATKRVGIRAIHGEECKSALPARVIFDKDNPPRR